MDVCVNSNKVTHFSEVNGPQGNVLEFENFGPTERIET